MARNLTKAGCLTVARTTGWVQTVGRCFARAGCRNDWVRNSVPVASRNDLGARCSARVESRSGSAVRGFSMEESMTGLAPERYVPRVGSTDCTCGGQSGSAPCKTVNSVGNSGRWSVRASLDGEACLGRSSQVSTGGCC